VIRTLCGAALQFPNGLALLFSSRRRKAIAPFGWIPARVVMPEKIYREVHTIIRHSLPAYPKFLARRNRLKNRFNFVVSNGDYLQVFDFNGAPEEIRTPDP